MKTLHQFLNSYKVLNTFLEGGTKDMDNKNVLFEEAIVNAIKEVSTSNSLEGLIRTMDLEGDDERSLALRDIIDHIETIALIRNIRVAGGRFWHSMRDSLMDVEWARRLEQKLAESNEKDTVIVVSDFEGFDPVGVDYHLVPAEPRPILTIVQK